MRTKRTIHGQGGQATVESAIILPLMIFMILGIIQLTMLQQAQLMTEYAAFSACRAGIVYNGDHTKMEGAARVSLAPTVVVSSLYPSIGLIGKGGIRQGTDGLIDLAEHVEGLRLSGVGAGLVGIPIIRVDTVHPNKSEFGAVANLGPSTNELEFDDIGYYKGNSAGGEKDGFFGNEAYRKALQLTIRVRYLYEMRVPFADWIIQTCWLAANAPSYLKVSGALGREDLGVGGKNAVNGGNNSQTTEELAAVAAVISPGAGNGKPIVSKLDYLKLVLARQNGWYLFPLSASYTMRMQSNFYRKHLDN